MKLTFFILDCRMQMSMEMEINSCTGFYITYIGIPMIYLSFIWSILAMRIMIFMRIMICTYGCEYFNSMPVFLFPVFFCFFFNVVIGYYHGKCSVASTLSRHDFLLCSHVVIAIWSHQTKLRWNRESPQKVLIVTLVSCY